MKKTFFIVMIFLGIGSMSCTNTNNSEAQSGKLNSSITKSKKEMKNLISIVEIPTTDFPRAVLFYQSILGITIEKMDMGEIQMGILPNDEETTNVTLIHSNDYKPSADGTVIYFNAGRDLQKTLDKIEPNGGKIIVPKTEISPEMGYFAIFADTEGNKLGLHSIQ